MTPWPVSFDTADGGWWHVTDPRTHCDVLASRWEEPARRVAQRRADQAFDDELAQLLKEAA